MILQEGFLLFRTRRLAKPPCLANAAAVSSETTSFRSASRADLGSTNRSESGSGSSTGSILVGATRPGSGTISALSNGLGGETGSLEGTGTAVGIRLPPPSVPVAGTGTIGRPPSGPSSVATDVSTADKPNVRTPETARWNFIAKDTRKKREVSIFSPDSSNFVGIVANKGLHPRTIRNFMKA